MKPLALILTKMHEKKFRNIIQLNNEERYDYLIRRVADFETIFLVSGRFWKRSTTFINGTECILVFPEKEFAKRHISSDKSKRVKEKNLYKFINWLEKNKTLDLAVFPNQNNDMKIVNSSELKSDLLKKCEQYE